MIDPVRAADVLEAFLAGQESIAQETSGRLDQNA
jgi:hypothetical protein